MKKDIKTRFTGGSNIAMKVPSKNWKRTVKFYRDIVKLKVLKKNANYVVFQFGTNRLWIDRVKTEKPVEIWLELRVKDIQAAKHHLAKAGVNRRDQVEPLPQNFKGFWVENPASAIHLVSQS